eukprot:TRINITY_DN9405_c0_g2_i1.p1 TRINITY_DN9405_c0_g2~~TRINITY_DN9405_c0_g2_i1.p1  ORF type:complete len:157 (+),score=21.75 TRINITY_DN9405_c0_g2_i1:18-488(+)
MSRKVMSDRETVLILVPLMSPNKNVYEMAKIMKKGIDSCKKLVGDIRFIPPIKEVVEEKGTEWALKHKIAHPSNVQSSRAVIFGTTMQKGIINLHVQAFIQHIDASKIRKKPIFFSVFGISDVAESIDACFSSLYLPLMHRGIIPIGNKTSVKRVL